MDLKFNTEPSAEHDDVDIFYPDFLNNLESKPEARAAFGYTRMTGKELMQLEQQSLIRTKHIKNQADSIAAAMKRDQAKRDKAIREHVRFLRNWWKVDETTKTRTEIASIDELRATLLASKKISAAAVLKLFDDLYDCIIGNSTIEEELLGESS